MFGYTVPLYSTMSAADMSAYRKYYCETCHHLKSEFGISSTSVVNYDMTFNTIILDSVAGDGTDFEGTKKSPLCVFGKPKYDADFMKKMAAYTILLTKWELIDDMTDKPSAKTNGANLILGKAIRKAEKMYPLYDESVAKGFEKLRNMELGGETDPVFIGKTFGKAVSIPLDDIAGDHSDKKLTELFIELAAAVYILDAVDDLDEDFMNETYNPYLTDRTGFVNKRTYIMNNIYSVTETINGVMGNLQSAYSAVRKNMKIAVGTTDNIVYYGLPETAKRILSGDDDKPDLVSLLDAHRRRNASR